MQIEPLFEQYQKRLEEQTKLDDLNLKEAQLKLPGYKHYWAGLIIKHKRDLAHLKQQKEAKKEELVEKIKTTEDVELSRLAIANKVNVLPEIKAFDNEIEAMEQLILYVEKAEQILKGMSFDIKNIIDIQKLENL
jgi:hypothetical protein